VEPDDAGLVDTARYLAELVQGLGAVEPALEQRAACAWQRQRAAERSTRLPRLRPGWAMAAAAAIVLAVGLFTPLGHTALASFLAVFNLGRTEVHVTPADLTSTTTAVAESTAVVADLTLEQAQAQVSFSIPQPADLPPGYGLSGVHSYSLSRPAGVDTAAFLHRAGLRRRTGTPGRAAPVPDRARRQGQHSRLNLEAAPIQDVRDVDVNGKARRAAAPGRSGRRDGVAGGGVGAGRPDPGPVGGEPDEDELMGMARSVR